MWRELAFSAVILAAFCATAEAQITVPDEIPDHEPIVATLSNPIPEGAQIQGGWSCSTARIIPLGTQAAHVWAAPGTHQIAFRGIWVKTRELSIDGQTVQVLEGFGFVDEVADFGVVGDTKPDPPPPPPGGPWQVMLFYDASKLDDLPEPQRQLLTSRVIRDRLRADGHVLLEVLESSAISSGVPADYQPWVDAVKDDPLPRIALAPKGGGKVRDYPLPANVDLLLALLEDPQ